MGGKNYIVPVILIVIGLLSIANVAIGIECLKSDKSGLSQREKKPSNYNFLVFSLVCSIIATIAGGSLLGYNIYKGLQKSSGDD